MIERLIQSMREAFMKDAASRGLRPDTMQLLEKMTQRFDIPASWGIHSPQDAPGGVAFEVDGFLYRGRVTVRRTGGCFTVTLEDDARVATAGADDLVDVIDRLVECDEAYMQRVLQAYGPVVMAR